MERVTEHCVRDSEKKFGDVRNIKVIFSQRGGHSYGQTKAYWELLRSQYRAGTTFLTRRVMRHE